MSEHVDYLEMPAWKLEERACLLKNNIDTIHYGPERYNQIKHELGMIALEMICRQLENQGHDPAPTLAMLPVDYFGFSAEVSGLEIGRADVQVQSKQDAA